MSDLLFSSTLSTLLRVERLLHFPHQLDNDFVIFISLWIQDDFRQDPRPSVQTRLLLLHVLRRMNCQHPTLTVVLGSNIYYSVQTHTAHLRSVLSWLREIRRQNKHFPETFLFMFLIRVKLLLQPRHKQEKFRCHKAKTEV